MPHNNKFQLILYFTIGIVILETKLQIGKYFLNRVNPIFQFCLFFFLLEMMQSLIKRDPYGRLMYLLVPYTLALAIILYLSNNKKEYTLKFLERVFFFVGIFFIIQFALSIYESMNNMYFDNAHNWALTYGYSNSVRNRWLLQVVGLDFNFLNLFAHPFSGLLGQQNFWASQLPFYNLIFLYMFYKSRRRYFLFLIFLVLIAVLFNTTRAAIFTIFITDIIYKLFIDRSKKYNYIIILGSIILLCLIIIAYRNSFLSYLSQSDTLSIRLENYSLLKQFFVTRDFPLLLGFDLKQLHKIENSYLDGFGFESYFFDVLFANGIIGLFLFVFFLVRIVRQARKFTTTNKYFGFLIFLNIVGVSLTLNGIMQAYTLPFVTLIYIYNVVTDSSYNTNLNFQNINNLKPSTAT